MLYTSQNLLGTIFRVTFAVLYRRIWSIVRNYSILYCDSKPYKYSDAERKMIQARTAELVEVGLVELAPPDYECTLATVMPSKKDIYGNWTKKRMCGDYRRINKFTKSDCYAMPTPEENFEVIGHAKVFSTLDLRSGYHQIGLREED
jgi:hypothetical protein